MPSTRTTLWRHLMAMGWNGGRRSEAADIRFTALSLAAFTIALCFGCLAVVHAAYAGKEDRRQGRTPVAQTSQHGSAEATLWLVGSDSLVGERRFSVVSITPHTADAPLPPGVAKWPEPGEFLLSPGLRDAGSGEGIEQRYGKFAGTIGHEGLEDPGEWLAYTRPAEGMSPAFPIERVVGYGPEAGRLAEGLEPGSGRSDDQPQWIFQSVVVGLLLVPSSVLLFAAARVGAYARDRRTVLIGALGGRRRDRTLITVGETWRPVVLGSIASAPLIAAAALVNLRVPHTDYLISSADVREYGWLAALAPLGAVVVTLGVAAFVDLLPQRRSGTRPYSAVSGVWNSRIAALAPPAVLVAVFGPDLAGTNTVYRVSIMWAGLAATVLTLPAAVASGVSRFGPMLERIGRRQARPAVLIAGRRAQAYPAAMTRLVAGIVVALIVFMQTIAWQALFGSQSVQMQQMTKSIDRSIAEVGPRAKITSHDASSFFQRLPDGSSPVLLVNTNEDKEGAIKEGVIAVYGSCSALELLGLSCRSEAVRFDNMPTNERLLQLLRWNSLSGTHVEAKETSINDLAERMTKSGEDGVLAILNPDGGEQHFSALKRISYEAFPRGAQIRSPGEEWLTASIPHRDQGRWVALFGMAGIFILIVTSGLSGMSELLRNGRALAPLSVLTVGPRMLRSATAWAVLVPLTGAGLVGIVVSSWLVRPVAKPGMVYSVPFVLVLWAGAVVLAASVLMWVWSCLVAERQARRWRPASE